MIQLCKTISQHLFEFGADADLVESIREKAGIKLGRVPVDPSAVPA